LTVINSFFSLGNKPMGFLRNIVDDNKFTPGGLPEFETKLFYEGAKQRVNLERFAVLLFLSTVIATFGVLGDSTATVIGAMIIAPLMTPIMATAAGLVMGNMERAGQAFLTVVLGVAGVIGVAWVIGTFHLGVISFTTNSQITARVSPSLIDLMVALASGAAGAFAFSRTDVADSLPGVAISIALVPPLAVVGLSLSAAEWDDALGAMLLFLTNFVSILLAGGGMFALLGLSAATTKELAGPARRKAFIYVALGALIVAIPLAATSIQVARESIAEFQTRRFTRQWLSDTTFDVNRIDAAGGEIEIVISGFGEPPPLPDLAADLQSSLGPDVKVKLKVVPSQVLRFPEPASD
jgi:uncharacterized hydrophobic protein (TIGR00271 family)